MSIAQRALVIFPGALGDFLCFLPVLRVLSRDREVDLLARSEFADLVPPTVRVGSLERYEIRRLFVPESCQEQRLRDFFSSYSSIFSWMGASESAFVQELNGLSPGRARIFPFHPPEIGLHQSDYFLACLGYPSPETALEIPLKSEEVAWSKGYWQQHFLEGKPVLTLAPGSGAREKNWPDAFFRAVAGWWRRQTGGAVVVVLGPVEEEKGDYAALCQQAVVARNLNLGKLAALLARSDVYLGNDSGVSHLAAAVGVLTTVLFGPSNVARWAPRGKNVTVLTQNIECAPCPVLTMENCPHRKCLTTLTAEYVIQRLAGLAEKLTLTRGGVGITVNAEIPK